MINYIEHSEAIDILTQYFVDERLIPIFGAGFSKGSPSFRAHVPDGNKCNELMKDIIRKYIHNISEDQLSHFDFNESAKRLRKGTPSSIPEKDYTNFFKNHFTEVNFDSSKRKFLSLPWSYAFTINVDDGIERTGEFEVILPYKNARKWTGKKRPLYKLHGDASYEIKYNDEDNIIFDSDQYTQSLISDDNQTMRDNFSNAYKEFNLLYIGCSLKNEPDIKYIYNSVKKECNKTKRMTLGTKKLSVFEEQDLEDYGITDVILVKDFDLFYIDLINSITSIKIQEKILLYPYTNPKVEEIQDNDYKYFSGSRIFDDHNNTFYYSDLFIERDCLEQIEESLKKYNIIIIEGRRFSGKTTLLSSLCKKEKRRTIFFFPSTTLEDSDIIQGIIENNNNSLLIFDSNAMSSETYFMFQDISKTLISNNVKIIIAFNQSDYYLSETVSSDTIILKNNFTIDEINKLEKKGEKYAFFQRKVSNTNLDYLNILKEKQKILIPFDLHLPSKYTLNEQILLILLSASDKVYSRDIKTLKIKDSEIKSLLSRANILIEYIPTAKGERNMVSTRKLVHNSKINLFNIVCKLENEEIINSILRIVIAFKKGDNNQKKMYRDVMQFDTLNQLFGGKSGAGKLISEVYKALESELMGDLHFWLQRSKSIYRLNSKNPIKLKTAYSYAKKVYEDSENSTLTCKAALTVSLICGLLYNVETNEQNKEELRDEAIKLGYEAIFSDYYKPEKRLSNDLNLENKKNYSELIIDLCRSYTVSDLYNYELNQKANEIIKKLS